MSNDGSQLEALVAFVERTLVPQGFDVKTKQRVYNDESIQIAQFDVEVRGKVGSTAIAWLIECRDRPASGPAPGSWIEQLVGRRARFGFNKVTAVSTTGFATGAVEFAREQGIELREVASLTPDAFSSWLELRAISQVVSQVAAFAPHEMQGMNFSLELHRLGETGETHVLLREVDRDA